MWEKEVMLKSKAKKTEEVTPTKSAQVGRKEEGKGRREKNKKRTVLKLFVFID